MKMLKTKHFRRLAVFLAMIAPAVYLFGSLFSALTGAHGTQVFAGDVEDSKRFDSSLIHGYGLYSDNGLPYDSSTGDITDFVACPYVVGGSYTVTYLGDSIVSNLRRIYFYADDYSFISLSILSDSPSFVDYPSNASFYRFYFDSSGMDFAYLTLNMNDPYPAISASDYNDYVFKQFFAKDNFLVQWGENAISDNPHGFAPFGAFWRYLDLNVLHLSSEQIGLMAYGYMYYACHVLLFDIAFILVTFFLDFIQKVNDKVVGGVD